MHVGKKNHWLDNCPEAPVDEWLQLAKSVAERDQHAMNSILDLVGLPEVKKIALDIFVNARSQMQSKQKLGKGMGSLNFTFVGNPGTGKTTVARIFAKLLQQAGARHGSQFLQMTASEALRKGEDKFATELASLTGGKRDSIPPAEAVLRQGMDVEVVFGTEKKDKWYPAKIVSYDKEQRTYSVEFTGDKSTLDDVSQNRVRAVISKTDLGGVLFIDEAYDLCPKKSTTGAAILNEIMNAAEEHRDKLTIILAGYQKEIEDNLYEFNPGMASRFANVPFRDFNEKQLRKIWKDLCDKEGWQSSEEVSDVASRRVARGIGGKGFGNARAVRNLMESSVKSGRVREFKNKKNEEKLTIVDVIGPEPSQNEDLKAAMADLDKMVGLRAVKHAIRTIVTQASVNYHNEMMGEAVDELALNRIFFGNPGTGKTTVAKIYGRVLKALRLLPKAEVVYKTASDFKGEHVGSSQERTKAILKMAEEKVLLIDEAYVLDDEGYGKEVLDTIVEKVTGSPGEQRAVILCGYKQQILKMLRDQNPGLASRFNRHNALDFENFSKGELEQIFLNGIKEHKLECSSEVIERATSCLSRASILPNFGNARSVNSLITDAKQRLRSRSSNPRDRTLCIDDVDPGRPQNENPAEHLKDLEDMPASKWLKNIGVIQKNRHLEGDSVLGIVTNLIFTGPPGTGKTTVARRIGKVLHSYGLLASDIVVETSGSKITGQYLGHTENNVRRLMEEAQGGVLFIDEAYQMAAQHSFGSNAVSTLLGMLTEEAHVNGKTVVILAGYEADINHLLSMNPGLRGRFPEVIEFTNWPAERCCKLIERICKRPEFSEPFSLEPDALEVLREGFQALEALPGWSNARDVETLFKQMRDLRDLRVAAAPNTAMPRTFKRADAEGAIDAVKKTRTVSSESRSLLTMSDYERAISQAEPSKSQLPGVKQSTATKEQPIQFAESRKQRDSKPAEAIREESLPILKPEELPKVLAVTSEADPPKKKPSRFEAVHNMDEPHAVAQKKEEKRRKELEAQLKKQEERIEKCRKRIEDAIRKQKEEEAERLRKLQEKIERELREMKEKEQRRQRIIQKLSEIGLCPQGFQWLDYGNYYRCAGGSHTVSKEQICAELGISKAEIAHALS